MTVILPPTAEPVDGSWTPAICGSDCSGRALSPTRKAVATVAATVALCGRSGHPVVAQLGV